MPTLIQRAETFVVNTSNPTAKKLVLELIAEIFRMQDEKDEERAIAATRARLEETE